MIGAPQPAVVALEREGAIEGRVLDPGCGAGEHTILLHELGYSVLGIDLSSSAVAYARRNAAAREAPDARFEVVDVLDPDAFNAERLGVFDTVLDSALFHVFGTDPDARAMYVAGLHRVCRPGGYLHLFALSDVEPTFGPQIGEHIIRDSFLGPDWELERLQAIRYQGRVTSAVKEQAAGLGLPTEGQVDMPAWQARIRRR